MSAAAPLHDRVCVVTGATSGIGLETARGLARLGATVVLVGRGAERLAEVGRQLESQTHSPPVRWVDTPDLAVRAEMERVATEISAQYPRVDVLVNNAGAIYFRRQETPDGIERTWALNVLAPFALSVRLAKALRLGVPSRIVNVASAAYRGQTLDFNDLQQRRRYSGYRAYARSKLALLLLSGEFARRLEGSGVTVNAVHPGFVDSGWGHTTAGWRSTLIGAAQRVGGISLERGARTSVYAASSPALDRVSGAYLSGRRAVIPSRRARDPTTAHRLFDECARLAGVPSEV